MPCLISMFPGSNKVAQIHLELAPLPHPRGLMFPIHLEGAGTTPASAKQLVLFLLGQSTDSWPESGRFNSTLCGEPVKQAE